MAKDETDIVFDFVEYHGSKELQIKPPATACRVHFFDGKRRDGYRIGLRGVSRLKIRI